MPLFIEVFSHREGETHDSIETLFNVPDFYTFADGLGNVIDAFYEQQGESILPYQQTFREYIGENRDQWEAAFARFCAENNELAAMVDEDRLAEIGIAEASLLRAEPEEFHADVRALLGRFFLGEGVIDFNTMQTAGPFFAIANRLLEFYLENYKEDTEDFQVILFLQNRLEILLNLMSKAVDEERQFFLYPATGQ